jgi:hypothetical protein
MEARAILVMEPFMLVVPQRTVDRFRRRGTDVLVVSLKALKAPRGFNTAVINGNAVLLLVPSLFILDGLL